MAHYKDLNKELVEQVQAMRISLQEYREEIINLRHKWMCKHEELVKMRQKCNTLALMHCRQYLEFLDPETPILSSLPLEGQEISPKTSAAKGEDHSNKKRQSARLSDECRRSSSLTQTRKSFNATSPIRSSVSSSKEVEEINNVDDDDDDVVETEVESIPAMLTNAIPEEDEEKIEEEERASTEKANDNYIKDRNTNLEETSSTSRTLCQNTASTEEDFTSNISLQNTSSDLDTIVHQTRSLRDISNIVGNTNSTIQKKNVEKSTNLNSKTKNSRCHKIAASKRNKTSDPISSDTENESPTPLNSPIMEKSSRDKKINHVTVNRGKSRLKDKSKGHIMVKDKLNGISQANRTAKNMNKPLTASDTESESFLDERPEEVEHEEEIEEESIQEARFMTREKHHTGEFFYVPVVEETAGSCGISEISFSQFDDATSSTPRQSVRNTMPSESVTNLSSRPKRSCKPKSMVEPRINTKMRNESNEKSLTSRKRTIKLKKIN